MEMIGLLLAIISTAATIWGLFARTDALLTDIHDELRAIHDTLSHSLKVQNQIRDALERSH